ncbi:uncharacterized protein BO95DRAFT_438073 [Aspergillus brunneoviolaceus CBS 621.78]|uniref:Uncharacterized protein n=1 Tax=Aspergillus brunneoviolaceus CBS 621.78 TaxID=1450534 RepID=A0ACD1GNI5_9EURO|nr:hypothetical protein BO95DRAFT_438073 [Aspergillus brunneoviolaceus CBS 621.78]RAH50811.1 hypothetical protein BO95DRAFT_438073 [Aspergillus brunneoviolaceus CBS 621.78]
MMNTAFSKQDLLTVLVANSPLPSYLISIIVIVLLLVLPTDRLTQFIYLSIIALKPAELQHLPSFPYLLAECLCWDSNAA